MSIETKIPTGEINIHALSLESPEEQALEFDPRKELSLDDWIEMEASFDTELSNNAVPYRYMSMLAYIKILKPDFEPAIASNKWSFIKETMLNQMLSSDWDKVLAICYGGKLSGSAPASLQSFEFIYDHTTEINNHLDFLWTQKESLKLAGELLALKIVAPDFKIPAELYNSKIALLRADANLAKSNHNYDKFIHIAGSLKILDPEFDFNLTPNDWIKLKNDFKEVKKNESWEKVARMAANLKFLAADKVEVDGAGNLNLIMISKKLKEKNLPLPQIKKF